MIRGANVFTRIRPLRGERMPHRMGQLRQLGLVRLTAGGDSGQPHVRQN